MTASIAAGAFDAAAWNGWINHHRLLFVWDSDDDLNRLDLWARDLAKEGLRPDEMVAASESLLRDPPRFKADFFVRLRKAALAARRALAAPEPKGLEACAVCHGMGAFAAPHPERDGWCDLLCSCNLPPAGPEKYERIDPAEYRRRCPGWPERVAACYAGLARRAPLLEGAVRRLEANVFRVLEVTL
jgi:hypothetical protein